jgi:hypothetical protein
MRRPRPLEAGVVTAMTIFVATLGGVAENTISHRNSNGDALTLIREQARTTQKLGLTTCQEVEAVKSGVRFVLSTVTPPHPTPLERALEAEFLGKFAAVSCTMPAKP